MTDRALIGAVVLTGIALFFIAGQPFSTVAAEFQLDFDSASLNSDGDIQLSSLNDFTGGQVIDGGTWALPSRVGSAGNEYNDLPQKVRKELEKQGAGNNSIGAIESEGWNGRECKVRARVKHINQRIEASWTGEMVRSNRMGCKVTGDPSDFKCLTTDSCGDKTDSRLKEIFKKRGDNGVATVTYFTDERSVQQPSPAPSPSDPGDVRQDLGLFEKIILFIENTLGVDL